MTTTTYNKYFCQHCGNNSKWVETIVYDEFVIEEDGTFFTNGYGDDFEHTGKEVCTECNEPWTGVDKED